MNLEVLLANQATATQALAIQQRDPRTWCWACGEDARLPHQSLCPLCDLKAKLAVQKARFAPGPAFLLNTKTGELKFR